MLSAPSIAIADLERPEHRRDVLALTAEFARETTADGSGLSPDARRRLVPGLRAHPTTLILLARNAGEAIGIATCFVGFSTFQACQIVNVHDLFVREPHRGRGVGKALLRGLERAARERGYAKVTLEVEEHNQRARAFYETLGFRQLVYDAAAGGALFYAKPLAS